MVAVKRVRNTLSSDRLVVARLADEARLLRNVSHPNVVRALDHGVGIDGLPFLVMDRAYGTPLSQLIAERGCLSLDRTSAIAAQLFAGLAAIHDARIVHADLKSHNVLVDDVDIVTIIDFGLARTVTKSPTTSGMVAGTPAYMAPELIAGAAPAVTADIYAAGVIVYEMLTGTTPFSGHISTILTRQLSEPIEPPSRRAPECGISEAIDRVLLRALDPSPQTRFQSVAELSAAFAAAADTHIEPVLAVGSDVFGERPTTPRRAVVLEQTEAQGTRTSLLISASLSHAQRLMEEHRVDAAVRELEATVAQLLPMFESDADRAEMWRIETVLAALYDLLGRSERARRMALVAYRHALKSGCPLAESRSKVLVDRLVARGKRFPRGSVGPK